MARAKKTRLSPQAAEYRHQEQTSARPDVGTQPQFKKRAPPKTWRYDSSLSPALEWDGQNAAREQGEALIAELEARIRELRAMLAQQISPSFQPSPARGEGKKGKTGEAHEKKTPSPLMGEGGGGGEEPRRLLDEAEEALRRLKALSKPFLNWAGKAERLSFDVPTLPLFIHERLSTRAILETLKGHKQDKQLGLFDLFADPQRPIHEQVLRAYEYQDQWVNRMILGDSMVVMNSLLHYESLGGQVQMVYMDPPYGVKFGSNFQPFVRKRDVSHNDDDDMTREPEMVQAYRDTWELGLHSYLTYLRDRLLLSRELLAPSGSIFVQISDENLHHVRELLDEVFGATNACPILIFQKTTGAGSPSGRTDLPPVTTDFILWYAKDIERVRYKQVFAPKVRGEAGATQYDLIEIDGKRRPSTAAEKANPPYGGRFFAHDNLTSQTGGPTTQFEVEFEGKRFYPRKGGWKTNHEGMERLRAANRLFVVGESLRYVRYLDDFPCSVVTNKWDDTVISGFGDPKVYVVQTTSKVVERCLLMTTQPGDIVVDPTCGSGTTAYVAEQWGRRWITVDTSRVPLALARQRLLTATFLWYELKDESGGPAGGFVYKHRQNEKGEEVGGIVPHIMLSTIANNEPPPEEVLVDRPEEAKGITRVSGPFVVEATIPTAMDFEEAAPPSRSSPVKGEGAKIRGEGAGEEGTNFLDRMLEVLRKSPVLRLEGNRTVTIENVRRPAKTLSLSAEAMVANGAEKPVAFVFGPENGAIAERLVYEAAKEATAKNYAHLYVVGFAIQPTARQLVDSCEAAIGISATYVQATPDLMMGDLLKNMRSSQIFSVCGLPEVALRKANRPAHVVPPQPGSTAGKEAWYEIELLGLDVFDPVTMEVDHRKGDDVPAWLLDTDYNGLSFHVCQAFFPRTAAWDSLKRALKGEYEDAVWEHLAGTTSVPFEAGEHGQVAVKVIDDRGNELMVVKSVKEAK